MKVTKTREIWSKVGEKEEVVGEYNYGSFVCPSFAFLWNDDIDNTRAMKIVKILLGVKKVKEKLKKEKK